MQQAFRLVQAHPVADGGEDVVQAMPVGGCVEDLVSHHQRRAVSAGQVDQRLVAAAVAGREVVEQLDEDPVAAEDLLVERKPVLRIGNQRDQPGAERGERLRLEARGPLGIWHLRAADQPAEVRITGPVLRQQDQAITPAVEINAVSGWW